MKLMLQAIKWLKTSRKLSKNNYIGMEYSIGQMWSNLKYTYFSKPFAITFTSYVFELGKKGHGIQITKINAKING